MTRIGWMVLALSLPAAYPSSDARADGPGYRVIKRFTLGGDGGWDYLTLDGQARRLYIARANRVMVMDVDKGTLVGDVANTPGVHGVALVPELDHGYVSNGGDAT